MHEQREQDEGRSRLAFQFPPHTQRGVGFSLDSLSCCMHLSFCLYLESKVSWVDQRCLPQMDLLPNSLFPLGSKGWPGVLQLFLELIFVCRHFTGALLSILSFSVPTQERMKEKGPVNYLALMQVSLSCYVRHPMHCFWLCYSYGFYSFSVEFNQPSPIGRYREGSPHSL